MLEAASPRPLLLLLWLLQGVVATVGQQGALSSPSCFSFHCSAASAAGFCFSWLRNVLCPRPSHSHKQMLTCLWNIFIQMELVCNKNQTFDKCFFLYLYVLLQARSCKQHHLLLVTQLNVMWHVLTSLHQLMCVVIIYVFLTILTVTSIALGNDLGIYVTSESQVVCGPFFASVLFSLTVVSFFFAKWSPAALLVLCSFRFHLRPEQKSSKHKKQCLGTQHSHLWDSCHQHSQQ